MRNMYPDYGRFAAEITYEMYYTLHISYVAYYLFVLNRSERCYEHIVRTMCVQSSPRICEKQIHDFSTIISCSHDPLSAQILPS